MNEMPVTVEDAGKEAETAVGLTGGEYIVKSKPIYDLIKRTFDIAASFVASVILAIPIGGAALAIALKDHGSPFYFQRRLGRGGEEIKVAKLRTMRKGADDLEKMLTPEQLEEYRREYKLDDDPRLIGWEKPGDGEHCFGAKLRRLSIDELAQIPYNILFKGTMSIVGPRPILQTELEENYTPEQQRALLSVKPGLTGYWQAFARNDGKYLGGVRQQMELYYVAHRSAWLDMKIILATVKSVLLRKGAK